MNEPLLKIIELCEKHQNADIEGKDPQDCLDASDRLINQIVALAVSGLSPNQQDR